MSKQEFYRLIEGIIEAPAGTIRGDVPLAGFSAWDSMALVGLIAALDKHLGITVPARDLVAAKTADEIAALAGDKISG